MLKSDAKEFMSAAVASRIERRAAELLARATHTYAKIIKFHCCKLINPRMIQAFLYADQALVQWAALSGCCAHTEFRNELLS
jgi:hypothetical protein